MKSVRMLMPYFGKWPEWIDFFIESCKWNPSIDWLFFTDCKEPANTCANVDYVHMNLYDFNTLASRKLEIEVNVVKPLKLCDYKPTYGMIFGDYIKEKDYWGFGDVDVIYGDIRKFIADDILKYNMISFNNRQASGHLCLLKNTPLVTEAFKKIPRWESKLRKPHLVNFDEGPEYVKAVPKKYMFESFNTPNSPDIPWVDGSFNFPEEWYWKEGCLTNDQDGDREFPYLHFMHWKGGKWPRRCGNAQWEKLERIVHLNLSEITEGFRINEKGFFKLTPDVPSG